MGIPGMVNGYRLCPGAGKSLHRGTANLAGSGDYTASFRIYRTAQYIHELFWRNFGSEKGLDISSGVGYSEITIENSSCGFPVRSAAGELNKTSGCNSPREPAL